MPLTCRGPRAAVKGLHSAPPRRRQPRQAAAAQDKRRGGSRQPLPNGRSKPRAHVRTSPSRHQGTTSPPLRHHQHLLPRRAGQAKRSEGTPSPALPCPARAARARGRASARGRGARASDSVTAAALYLTPAVPGDDAVLLRNRTSAAAPRARGPRGAFGIFACPIAGLPPSPSARWLAPVPLRGLPPSPVRDRPSTSTRQPRSRARVPGFRVRAAAGIWERNRTPNGGWLAAVDRAGLLPLSFGGAGKR